MHRNAKTSIALTIALAAAPAAFADAHAEKIERGRVLVTVGGCNDCHTPLKMGPSGPEPDMKRMLSGHPQELVMPPAPQLPPGPWVAVGSGTMTAWSGPWGVSFVSNITPDPETGIGKWSEQDFKTTVRSGHRLGTGRALLPPMPWPNLAATSDEDLSAIYAYLMSVPPVKNKVPEPLPPAAASAH